MGKLITIEFTGESIILRSTVKISQMAATTRLLTCLRCGSHFTWSLCVHTAAINSFCRVHSYESAAKWQNLNSPLFVNHTKRNALHKRNDSASNYIHTYPCPHACTHTRIRRRNIVLAAKLSFAHIVSTKQDDSRESSVFPNKKASK